MFKCVKDDFIYPLSSNDNWNISSFVSFHFYTCIFTKYAIYTWDDASTVKWRHSHGHIPQPLINTRERYHVKDNHIWNLRKIYISV